MALTDTPEYQALLAATTAAAGAEESAVVALNGLGAYIAAHKNDPAALSALATALQQPNVDLAAAIAANPVPVDAPPPTPPASASRAR
jgi:hypothetical protein